MADLPKYAIAKQELRMQLENWMRETADPRAGNKEAIFDTYPYYGGEDKAKEAGNKAKPPKME